MLVRLRRTDHVNDGDAVPKAQRRLHGIGHPADEVTVCVLWLLLGVRDDQAVDDGLDVVNLVAGQVGDILQLIDLAVDPDADEAQFLDLLKDILMMPLAPAHQRRQHPETGAAGHPQERVDDLLRALLGHLASALGTVGYTDARVEQAEIVVDLGYRPDRRAGIVRDAALVDGDGGAETLNSLNVRFVHLPEKLPRVRTERFNVPALSLGEDRVEG